MSDYIQLLKVKFIPAQCEPANAENPRLKEDAMDLACKLIEEFDRIEHSKSVLALCACIYVNPLPTNVCMYLR